MKSAYPLLLIASLVIFFYLLSVSFVRIGLLSKVYHRKFWNVNLLISFLTVGAIGLMMIVKINYKLELPFYDSLLRYHVDFGIVMILIGMFHLWWHLDYYHKLFKIEKSPAAAIPFSVQDDLNGFVLKISIFLLGATAMVAQIILLREFMSVFNGNELVVGLVLANWMVLTGFGAMLGKQEVRIKKTSGLIISGLLILTVLPFITTFLINYLKNIIFPIGAMIDVFQIFLASLLLLIPFCVVSGFLFTFISGSYSNSRGNNETGSVYGFESVGSITGGLLTGLIFIFLFSSAESLLVLAAINGFVIFLICRNKGVPALAMTSLVIGFSAITLLFFQPEKMIRRWVYPNQVIVVSKDTPYGNIVRTRQMNLTSTYINNTPLYDSENFMINEETVHFAMIQHNNPSNILVVSGDLLGQIRELMKYNPESIDCVEENRWLLALSGDSLSKIESRKIRIYSKDPIRFIRNTLKIFDIALLNLPAPSSLQNNRFYTLEFFTLLKRKLSPGAVLCFGLPAPVNYMNKEAVALTSTLFMTLKRVFQNVVIIPGEKNYFIASDNKLTYEIATAIHQRGISNRYVNPDYFDNDLLKSRGESILSALSPDVEINRNLRPVLYQDEMDYWLSHFKGKFWLMAFLAGMLAIVIFISGNTPSKIMFVTGFSATGLEILLLFGIQVYFGTIYLLTSFVFTGFMAGLAFGSFRGKSIKTISESKYLYINQLLIGFLAAGTAFLLFAPGILNFAPAIVYLLYLSVIVSIGTITGLQYTRVSICQTGSYANITGWTYSYDLYGSAFGALVVTLYLIPNMGIVTTAIILAFCNILYGIYLTLKGY